ncbi:hypothetical protein E8L90_05415 [Brevibacillus antibioticus]|uniref:Uncharacterized protein n=1 Tax=Brevibacillus antibioticus TaxID=2570228 RepID=A0A4U2Y3A1_9BACL|nr:hypothetical protein [Brevibacillus antibioticus]TKI54930.1 hypothetical protein E8L90_05415 [Brevibacillus antibioticus]
MEWILQNTDIFDEDIDSKFNKVILENKNRIEREHIYKFRVSFHVNLLNDNRFEKFNIIDSKRKNDGSKKDKMYAVLSFQLEKLSKHLTQHDIEVYSLTIQGDYLEAENQIKIELIEDKTEATYTKGKKNVRAVCSSIIPSLPSTRENISYLASKRLSEIYSDLMNIISDKKLMSEILEIEETDNNNVLFQQFAKLYGDLWLTTKDRAEELRKQFKDRSLYVIEKRLEKEKNK